MKSRKYKLLSAILILALLFSIGIPSVHAQEPPDHDSEICEEEGHTHENGEPPAATEGPPGDSLLAPEQEPTEEPPLAEDSISDPQKQLQYDEYFKAERQFVPEPFDNSKGKWSLSDGNLSIENQNGKGAVFAADVAEKWQTRDYVFYIVNSIIYRCDYSDKLCNLPPQGLRLRLCAICLS